MPSLFDKRLVIVTGKGGVGKSTVAAALATLSAREGKRTLVCEVNTQERVSLLLGKRPAGPEITLLEENLWAVDIRPAEAMREYALMILKFQTIYRAVFENRLVRYFLRFIPSLQELVMLGKVLYHLQETLPDGSLRFERIILDAPATGHAIAFLSVPRVLLDTVPPGQLAREAEKMRALLTDRAVTTAVLVSLPEDMPVNETLDLHDTLTRKIELHPGAVVLNAFVADRFSDGDVKELQTQSPALLPLARGHHARAQLSVDSRERLEQGTRRPVWTLPRLYAREFDRACIDQLAAQLQAHVREPL